MSDVDPKDALQVAQRALAKANDLEEELEELRSAHQDAVEQLTKHELRLSEQDEDRDYDTLDRDTKIGMVREHAFDRAVDSGGRTTIDYNDVKWSVFDGEPGAAHCYNLMEWAAEAEGFRVRDPENGNRHLAVDADRAKSSRSVFSQKKDAREEEVI
jgi:hypothetical protein